MMHVMEAQQELVSRLAAACRGARRVPSADWLSTTLGTGADEEMIQLMRTVYPYSHSYAELPAFQRELLLERVRGALGRTTHGAPRAARVAQSVAVR